MKELGEQMGKSNTQGDRFAVERARSLVLLHHGAIGHEAAGHVLSSYNGVFAEHEPAPILHGRSLRWIMQKRSWGKLVDSTDGCRGAACGSALEGGVVR